MLLIFDDGLDVFTAMGIWILGALILLKLATQIGTRQSRVMLIYALHTLMCYAFTVFTLPGGVDSATYYQHAVSGPLNWELGTGAVPILGLLPARVFGVSYFGMNLLFAIAGCVGIVLMDQVLRLLAARKSRLVRQLSGVIAFLPSIHFWTASISKDSVMMLATGCLLWYAQAPGKRLPLLGLAILCAVIVRPHIAMMILAGLLLASIVTGNMKLGTKIAVTGIAGGITMALLPFVLTKFGVGAGLGDISTFIEDRQAQDHLGGSSIALSEMSPPMRLFSFLMRPMIYEGGSGIALSAGLENTLLLILVVMLGCQIFLGRRTRRSRQGGTYGGGYDAMGNPVPDPLPGRALVLCYGLIALWLLANTTYNLGLASRQKWMVLPFLMAILIDMAPSTAAVRARLAAAAAAGRRPPA